MAQGYAMLQLSSSIKGKKWSFNAVGLSNRDECSVVVVVAVWCWCDNSDGTIQAVSHPPYRYFLFESQWRVHQPVLLLTCFCYRRGPKLRHFNSFELRIVAKMHELTTTWFCLKIEHFPRKLSEYRSKSAWPETKRWSC